MAANPYVLSITHKLVGFDQVGELSDAACVP